MFERRSLPDSGRGRASTDRARDAFYEERGDWRSESDRQRKIYSVFEDLIDERRQQGGSGESDLMAGETPRYSRGIREVQYLPLSW